MHDSDPLLVLLSIYGPLIRVAGGVSVSEIRIKRIRPTRKEWAFFLCVPSMFDSLGGKAPLPNLVEVKG